MKHDVQLTANELRTILYLLKQTRIDEGYYPLFVNLQEQFRLIKLKEIGSDNEDVINNTI
jgi:phenolic acid decarboxylase